jgi:hypothetical protein
MLNTLTITAEQEKVARDQAFYLLKKYTSFTLLDKARALYQGFLDAFAKQINELPYPPNDQYVKGKEISYKEFLRYMIPLEKGLHLLRTTPHKPEAYARFENFSYPIWQALFGRGAHEMGISYDAFYEKLGMTAEEDQHKKPHTDFIENNVNASMCIIGLVRATVTQCEFEINDRKYISYNYETLLLEQFYPKKYPYLYAFNFPEQLPPGPPHNLNSAGQIWSDEEIQITGIYEPWLTIGKVGCPNYFLAGQKAIEYQLEGTQDKEKVRWRLLWEDRRYLDGTIPDEEAHYLQDPSAAQPKLAPTTNQVLMAHPSQPCPQAGLWFAPRLQNQTVRMQLGEPMPVQTMAPSGAVIWYYKGP